ncbi:MAG: universal stress protein UspA [Rhodospirillaceae bacterium BRH_c57]|nr:MAG: universal stress protein UspA [Rhodospirillaceae bacterium BRH_c57]
MPKILTLTDGSVYAPSVYDHAAWAAKRMGASVEVLHVLDHHREKAAVTDFSGNIGVDARDELLTQLAELDAAKSKVAMTQARVVLDHARAHLTEAGVTDLTLSQRHGPLVETLEEVEASADLVVIGKRGEAADFATGHLGANLERVIRGSTKPVLVANRAFKPINRLLIAYDGGTSARKAVSHVATRPLLQGIECHLLMVGAATAANQEKLALAREELAAGGLESRATLIEGEPESRVGEYVKSEGIDLLVVGAYGHSRIRHLIIGSTTTTLIRTCQVPLLMFR